MNPSNQNQLKIMQLNCNSIVKIEKRIEIVNLIIKYLPDLVFLCETFTKPRHIIAFDGYKVIRNDRENQMKGGTIILIKNELKFEKLNLPYLNSIPNTSLIKIYSRNDSIIAASIYCPQILNTNDLTYLLGLGNKVIIAGDYNAKSPSWYCNNYNHNGRVLETFLMNQPQLELNHPISPTRLSSNLNSTDSIIDLVISKNIRYHINPYTIDPVSSDHLPITYTIKFSSLVNSPETYTTYKNYNWNIFNSIVNHKINHTVQINTVNELNVASENFTKAIIEAKSQIPKKIRKGILISPEIINLINLKKQLKKLWVRSRELYLKAEINALGKTIKHSIINEYNTNFNNKIVKTNGKLNEIHKLIKNNNRKNKNAPYFTIDNTQIHNDKDKAEIIASHFENAFNSIKDRPGTSINTHTNFINSYISWVQPTNNSIIMTPKTLQKIINKLKINKSPGEDQIPNIILKHLNKKPIILLSKIINASYNLGHFPNNWKITKIIPILKPGKLPNVPISYRPISLLNSLSKLCEIALLTLIQKHLKQNNIIPEFQFGFNPGYGTTEALVRLNDHILEAKNKKHHTVCVFLDVEKAFDTVWHELLIKKLIILNFDSKIVRFIKSYLEKRTFYVELNGEKSNRHQINAGVPQGSILGPILYNIFSHDIPVNNETNISAYADDIVIYASGANPKCVAIRIQEHLNKISDYFTQNKIKINIEKSNYIIITNKQKFGTKTNPKPIKYNDIPLQNAKEIKYLGLEYSSKMSWFKHISNVKTITYAMPAIYTSITKADITTLEILERKCLRKIIKYKINISNPRQISNRKLYEKCNIENIKEYIIKISKNAIMKIKESNNSLLSSLGTHNSNYYRQNKYKSPTYILNVNNS